MFSNLELRSIIESSFLPKRCECIQAQDSSLTIKVYDSTDPQRVDLVVTGISAVKLDSSRAICNLITQLREDLADQPFTQTSRFGARNH